ncbi:hypothetical protein C4S77_04635 [Apibacter adventoris]|uniref:Uncharacterized protein n=1 Tax=Apibacter adventoris TaxID=1679466 RepID=A0A2S8AEM0_9FLAO|nr:hypothetical protein C4S77_04635 [Apibacter adventoris]
MKKEKRNLANTLTAYGLDRTLKIRQLLPFFNFNSHIKLKKSPKKYFLGDLSIFLLNVYL